MVGLPLLIRHLRTASIPVFCAFATDAVGASAPQTFEGMYVGDWEGSIFAPCEDKDSWWFLDSKDPKLLQTLMQASQKSFAEHDRALFIVFDGFTTDDKPDSMYDYSKTVWVTRIISIQTLDHEKSQCRTDQKPATPNE